MLTASQNTRFVCKKPSKKRLETFFLFGSGAKKLWSLWGFIELRKSLWSLKIKGHRKFLENSPPKNARTTTAVQSMN